MSIEAAIGRIDQILALQQSVMDPAAALASANSATSTAGGTSSTGSSFADQLASAQSAAGVSPLGSSTGVASSAGVVPGTGVVPSTGLVPSTGVAATTVATSAADPRVQAMINEADSLVGKPYVYGGGHSGWGPQSGYDCSGFVSAVLHAGGYLSSPQDTVTLPSQPGMESGPGQYVTIFDRSLPGQSGHVIIDIEGQFYESGGEHGAWGGGGGVEKIATPSASYLSTFDTILHPAGL